MHVSLLRRGFSPCVGPVGALGELRWLHLYRLTPDLVGLLLFAGCRWCSGRCFMFYCAPFRPYSWRSFWSVSLTPACPLRVTPLRGCSLDICVACDWLGFLSSSSLFRDSVICADLWSRQQGPVDYCDRHSVALALSPPMRWF